MSDRSGVRLGPRGGLQGRLIALLLCGGLLGVGSCASGPGAEAPDIVIAGAAATGDRYPLIHGRADEVAPFWHPDRLKRPLLDAGTRAQFVAVVFVGQSRAATRSAMPLALDRTVSFIAAVLAS